MARGRVYSLAYFQTFSVCTCTPATASTTMTAAPATRRPPRASATKSPYPGVSIRMTRCPFQSQKATAVPSEILRLISSGSKSVVVVPSTLPSRLTAPAANSMDSTRDVLPTPPWPARPTLRILEMSVAMPASPLPRCERETPSAGEKADVERDATTGARGSPEAAAGPLRGGTPDYSSSSGSSITCHTEQYPKPQNVSVGTDTPDGGSASRLSGERFASSGGNPGVSA